MQHNADSTQPPSPSCQVATRSMPTVGRKRKRTDSHQHTKYSHSVFSREYSLSQQSLNPTLATRLSLESMFPPPSVTSADVKIFPPSIREIAGEPMSFSRGSERPRRVESRGFWRSCRHWLTAYHILAVLTIIPNGVFLCLLIGRRLPLTGILLAVSTNLLVSILTRQDDLVNAAFHLVAKVPSSLPLAVRNIIADFHHYGGVHVGCAVAALLWYGLFVAVNTQASIRSVRAGSMTVWHWIDITTCYLFLLFIIVICLMAISYFRERLHDTFEQTHRFGGWASLLVLWVNSGIHTEVDTTYDLLLSPSIWLLSIVTFVIILPWLRIRRISIRAQRISRREVKLTFPYADMPYTCTSRFSTSPVTEWHGFATIPSRDGLSADIIVSAAGDWTSSIVANPPQQMWIRKPAATNFLAFAPMFNSVLLVATGTGIGPMLSLLSSPVVDKMKADGKRIRVMWCAHDPDAPQWAFVQTMIRKADRMPWIFDSRKRRPNIAFEARYLAQVDDLEAVMIVSNKKVTNAVIPEVKAHGRAAYGAVFDS